MLDGHDILRLRLRRQLIERSPDSKAANPADVVARLCAVQAQDYAGALWAVGLRSSAHTTSADVERAIAEARIVRTWPMRGTLHFVAPADVRWMLALLAPRMIARAAGRHAQLNLTKEDFARARDIFENALSGGRSFTRAEMIAALESGGVSTAGQRGYHTLGVLAQQAVLCLGPMAGKQQTFVLLEEWVPPVHEPALDRETALARLANRYFEAHGPATLADFAWWSGLTKTDARTGINGAADDLECFAADETTYWLPAGVLRTSARPPTRRGAGKTAVPSVHLLPAFDEYMLGYTDRTPQLGQHARLTARASRRTGCSTRPSWSTAVSRARGNVRSNAVGYDSR